MPAKLERCVNDLKKKGIEESQAYAICTKSTGYVRSKNKNGKATWKKRRKKK